jgi:hypothetical protein
MTEPNGPIIARYRAVVQIDFLASVGLWSLGVYVSLSHHQAVVILFASSVVFVVVILLYHPSHKPTSKPLLKLGSSYRHTPRWEFVVFALWPWALGLAGIVLAEGLHPDLVALIVGSFIGAAAGMARELRRIASMERRHDGRVFIELAGRFGRSGIGRSKSRLWLMPGSPGDTL